MLVTFFLSNILHWIRHSLIKYEITRVKYPVLIHNANSRPLSPNLNIYMYIYIYIYTYISDIYQKGPNNRTPSISKFKKKIIQCPEFTQMMHCLHHPHFGTDSNNRLIICWYKITWWMVSDISDQSGKSMLDMSIYISIWEVNYCWWCNFHIE